MKRNKSIAIIACDHGFGHTRRCLLLANKLAETGWHVHLFAPKKAVDKMAKTIRVKKILLDFLHEQLWRTLDETIVTTE